MSFHVQELEERVAMAVNVGNARPYWGNGHYYAFTQEDIEWKDAYNGSRAKTLSQLGTTGYLATITSSGENDIILRYSNGGSQISRTAHTGGTDSNNRGTSEGRWIWKAPGSGDDNVVFRNNGNTPSGVYANWKSGQPDDHKVQDYLGIQTDGKWDDVDHDNDIQAYITEWGRDGVEFNAGFADLGSSSTVNGQENGQAAKMTINFDQFVPNEYVNIQNSNNTPLIDIPITFTGTAKSDTDYKMTVSGGNSYFSSGKLYVRNTQSVTLTFTPINNNTWQSPRTIKATLGSDGSENIYGISGNASSQVWIFDDEPLLSLGQGAYQFIRAPYTAGSSQNLPTSNTNFNTSADTLIFDTNGIDQSESMFNDQGFYDSFAMRWETYVSIPETGNYTFRTSSDDGHKLTLRRNNSNGTSLASLSNWSDGSKTAATSA
ncbi:MAG: PA14 domain-containing protein, partial [bacterium]